MTENSPVKERLTLLADHFGMSPNEFSLKIGKNRSFVKGITKDIGSDVLRQIYHTFRNVNIAWIVTGEGDMITGEEIKNSNEFLEYLKKEKKILEDKISMLDKENKELIQENSMLSTKLSILEKREGIEKAG